MDRKPGVYVVINHEEQYSIQPAERALPSRAEVVFRAASKEEAEAYVKRIWGTAPPRRGGRGGG